uniref:Ras-GAP domain-containing protein n=1 Tax=Panagrellus redivivus TaxID=6233 RepID=A0A7E4WAN9_PANRE
MKPKLIGFSSPSVNLDSFKFESAPYVPVIHYRKNQRRSAIQIRRPLFVDNERNSLSSLNSGQITVDSDSDFLEKRNWIDSLRRVMNPQRDVTRRTEYSVQIWILEAKGIPAKRRYFCELCLDKTLYAKTSSKPRGDICFWGEHFAFDDISHIKDICVNLYREADPKKKKDRNTLVGYVTINTEQLLARHPVERWYTITTGTEPSVRDRLSLGSRNNNDPPAMRIKARFQAVDILPLADYNNLRNFTRNAYLPLCLRLEPLLGVKAKEDLATSLVRILHKDGLVTRFLCDLIMSEVDVLDNEHLMFRGNSLATKAMEAYMKLVAAEYLKHTLEGYIKEVVECQADCEVDPQKLSNSAGLDRNRMNLVKLAQSAWFNIHSKAHLFPAELREVFRSLRERLHASGRDELADNLISSSIFLRFLCPAILSPSLFGLVREYPAGQASRTLTLIAKTLQTLANFTKFGGKESYMEFMNEFISREWDHMHDFLMRISRSAASGTVTLNGGECVSIDVGKELSLMHSYLEEVWTKDIHEQVIRDGDDALAPLAGILKDLRSRFNRPMTPSSSTSGGSTTNHNNSSPSDYENAHSSGSSGRPTPSSRHSTASGHGNGNGSRFPTAAPTLHTNDDYVQQSAIHQNDAHGLMAAGVHSQQNRRAVRPSAVQAHPNLGYIPRVQDYQQRPGAMVYDDTNGSTFSPPPRHSFSGRPEPARCSNPINGSSNVAPLREYVIYDDRGSHLYDHVPLRQAPSNGLRVKQSAASVAVHGVDSDSDESGDETARPGRPPRRLKRRSESTGAATMQPSSSGYATHSTSSSPIENESVNAPRALTISNPRYLASSSTASPTSVSSSGSPPTTIASSSKPSPSTVLFDEGFHTYHTSSSGVESATATMRTTSSESSQSSFERAPKKMLPRTNPGLRAQIKPATVVSVLDDEADPVEQRFVESSGLKRSVENLLTTEREKLLEQQVLKLTQENERLKLCLAAQNSHPNLAH